MFDGFHVTNQVNSSQEDGFWRDRTRLTSLSAADFLKMRGFEQLRYRAWAEREQLPSGWKRWRELLPTVPDLRRTMEAPASSTGPFTPVGLPPYDLTTPDTVSQFS